MQLSLRQSELVVAVRQYVAKQGLNLAGKDVTVLFSATRGEDGIKATIDIDEVDTPEVTNAPAQLRVVAPMVAIASTLVQPEPSPFVADEPVLVIEDAVEEPKAKSSLFS